MARRKFSSAEDFETWLDERAAVRLDRKRVFQAGNLVALYDAAIDALNERTPAGVPLDARDERGTQDAVTVPVWVLEALVDKGLHAWMSSLKTKGKGRRGVWSVHAWKQDTIDWQRFRQVWYRLLARREDDPEHPTSTKELRRRRADFHKAAVAKKSKYIIDMGTPYPRRTRGKRLAWKESNLPDDWTVFDAVAWIYKGSAYEGTPKEIERSYDRVTKALKDGQAWRYYPSLWLRCFEGQLLEVEAEQAR